MTIWLASGNAHKKREVQQIFQAQLIRSPDELGLDFNPEETGQSFLENALIKARALFALVREPVLADDSGLCVDALDGRPGLFSARYGAENGQKLDMAERNRLLLAELGDADNRRARFICSMVLLLSSSRFYAVQESLEGLLIKESRGKGGFGYDPIVYLPEYGCTVAELDENTKNTISHRGKAGAAIAAMIAAPRNT